MNIFMKRFTATILLMVLTLSTFFGLFNGRNVTYAEGFNSVNISSQEIVKGNSVYIMTNQNNSIDNNSYIVYSDEEGNEVYFGSYYNDDTGFYDIEVELEYSGLWTVVESDFLELTSYDDYSIEVYDDLESMTGRANGYIDLSALEENNNISGEEFESVFSQIKGYNYNGNDEEVEITLLRDGIEYTMYTYFDGISTSIRLPENLYLAPGYYEAKLSLSNFTTNIDFNLTSIYTNVSEELDEEAVDLSAVPALNMASTSNITSVNRISGSDRYVTAIEISKSKYSSANNIILVNGKSTNEILAASNLAKIFNAPILLTDSSTINTNTNNEIKRLKASNIYIVGDTSQVSSNIEASLRSQNYTVNRINGNNIYYTAVEIAKKVRTTKNMGTVILSSATSQADSLSAAAVSASYSYPILFTDKNSIPTETLEYLKNSNVNRVDIVGGTSTISDNVKKALENIGIQVVRYSGSDRYETSISIAERYFPYAKVGYIATGTVFVDSLAGAPIAGSKDSPVLLVSGNTVSSSLKNYITSKEMKTINILGGTSSVSGAFKSSLESTLNSIYNSGSGQSGSTTNTSKIKILLDPGHGAGSAHNRGYVGTKWKNEGDGNYYFSLLLKKELEAYGITVGTTRSNINQDPSLAARGEAAKGYDLFISLHTNASNGNATGVEIYEDVNARATKLATNLCTTISSTLNTNNRGVKYRYYDSTNSSNYYGVLRANEATAGMLIEHCFHDNATDVSKYEANAEILAKNMAKTIAQYYGLN